MIFQAPPFFFYRLVMLKVFRAVRETMTHHLEILLCPNRPRPTPHLLTDPVDGIVQTD
jgi:hypothetical protein